MMQQPLAEEYKRDVEERDTNRHSSKLFPKQ